MSKVLQNPTSDVLRLTSSLSLILSLLLALPAAAETPVPSPDPTSAYTPTQIVNGGFDQAPWMDYWLNGTYYDGTVKSMGVASATASSTIPNGVDGGWNTSTKIVQCNAVFDYQNNAMSTGYFKESATSRWIYNWNPTSMNTQMTKATLDARGGFIECNGCEAATLYQDLTTHGGDVVRWSFLHGVRYDQWASDIQPMTVFVGAPNGTPSNTDPAIVAATLGKYYSKNGTDGYAEGDGRAYGNVDELKRLYLTKAANATQFYKTAGVYVIPEGQGVTRFAFQSNAVKPDGGNWMDDVTFSTLIGNLGAKANADGSVTVTGYWGDADAAKKLCVKIGANVLQLDMAGVLNQNFTVTIPAATIGSAAQIEVYHQDYESAKRTVKIQHPRMYRILVEDGALKAYCTNTAHTVAGGCDHAGEANEIAVSIFAKNAPYTGAPYTRAKLTGDVAKWAASGLDLAFVYEGRGETSYGPSVTAPTEAGSYTAKAVSGSSTTSADFDIMRITIGEGVQVDGLVKLPVTIDGAMTLYSVSVSGAKLRITAASGTGWKFQDAVKSVKAADPTPVVGTDYLSISLVIDKSAIGAKTVAQVAEEALATLRYTKVVAEVKISGSYLGEDVALKTGDYFLNGHFYTLSSGCQTWVNAMNWAFGLMNSDPTRYPGYKSYPVTITSLEENQLLVNIWNNAHPEYVKGTEVWLPSVPKNMTGGSVSIVESAGTWSVSVTGIPFATENDGWKRANGCYGMGERYVWMTGVPEAGLPLPAETNAPSANGVYWSMTNPSNRGVNYFGHPNIGAVWDDLNPSGYNDNAWTSFSSDDTFHMYGLAEWEPKDPETVVTVSDTAKIVPVTFTSVSRGTTRGGVAFSSTNIVRKVGSADAIPVLVKDDCTFLGWTTKSGGSSIVEKSSAEIAALDPTLGATAETWYAVWSDVLTLGEFDQRAHTFPDAAATDGNTYPQVTIMFGREMSGEEIELPSGIFGYSEQTSLRTAYSRVVNVSPAKTAAEIASNYLAKVRFNHCVDQDVRVIIGNATSYKTFYYGDNEHYYQYVPYASSSEDRTWAKAYERAKGMTYAGRKGYLVTVTTTNEDVFVYKASAGVVGWMGGARIAHGAQEGQYYTSFDGLGTAGHWYWAGGPECGETFFAGETVTASSYSYNASLGYYFNWDNNEPNKCDGVEGCLTTLSFGSGYVTKNVPGIGSGVYSWNDIENANKKWGDGYAAVGFIVEFGDRRFGDTTDDDPTIASASGYVIATAIIKAPVVAFNAWGGYHGDDPTCEVTSNVCVDGVYTFPRFDPTRAGEYEFGGWFESWTNGARQVTAGGDLIVWTNHMVYAKWTSKSTPAGKGEKTFDYETAGDGAALKGATNTLTKTDLAIPELTSNGKDGIPYVIIKESAFASENYDKKREFELRLAGASEEDAVTNALTSVSISMYVTNIQAYAFAGCTALTNVTFSQTRNYETGAKTNLYIHDWAFKKSSVRSVTFPADSCVILDYGAFADAEYLEDIYILGDVVVASHMPFMGAGRRLTGGKKVTVHLSAKLAASPEYVFSLTNGMTSARLELSDQIVGEITDFSSVVTSDPMVFTFKVASDSPWLKVSRETVYLFYSKTLDDFAVGTGKVLHPDETPTGLTGPDASGRYRAEFAKPSPDAGFFKLCIGDSW